MGATTAARLALEAEASAELFSANRSAVQHHGSKPYMVSYLVNHGFSLSKYGLQPPAPLGGAAAAPQGAVPVQAPPPGGAAAEVVQNEAPTAVDKILWNGAAAAGWQVRRTSGSQWHYTYIAPNGTPFTNKRGAVAHSKGKGVEGAAAAPKGAVQWRWTSGMGIPSAGPGAVGRGGRGGVSRGGGGVKKRPRNRSPDALEPHMLPITPNPGTPILHPSHSSLHQPGEHHRLRKTRRCVARQDGTSSPFSALIAFLGLRLLGLCTELLRWGLLPLGLGRGRRWEWAG